MSNARKRNLWKIFYVLLTEKYKVNFDDNKLYEFIDFGIRNCISNEEDPDVYLEKYFSNIAKKDEALLGTQPLVVQETNPEIVEDTENKEDTFDYPVEEKVEQAKDKKPRGRKRI